MGTQLDTRRDFMKTLRGYLTATGPRIAQALPKHMSPDRMASIALTACSKTPELMNCTPESLMLALIQSSEFGLEPNGREAHLIPYGKICTFQMDYKGMVKLAYQSPAVHSFMGRSVYENDEFEYCYGLAPVLRHVPTTGERGKLKYAYAIAHLANGRSEFRVLLEEDIARAKATSASSTGAKSPWVKHTAAMWEKTAAKQLAKWIPYTSMLGRAISVDDASEIGKPIVDIDFSALEDCGDEGKRLIEAANEINAGQAQLEAPKIQPSSVRKPPKSDLDALNISARALTNAITAGIKTAAEFHAAVLAGQKFGRDADENEAIYAESSMQAGG